MEIPLPGTERRAEWRRNLVAWTVALVLLAVAFLVIRPVSEGRPKGRPMGRQMASVEGRIASGLAELRRRDPSLWQVSTADLGDALREACSSLLLSDPEGLVDGVIERGGDPDLARTIVEVADEVVCP